MQDNLSLRHVLANKKLLIMIIASMFVFGAHAAHVSYIYFFWLKNNWLEDKIGLFWGTTLIGEFLLFAFFKAKNLKTKILPFLAIFSILLSTVRFFFTDLFIEHFYVQLFLQLSNALTFSLMHLVIVLSILKNISSKYFVQWQTFYHFVSHGLSSAIVVLLGGFFYAYAESKYFFYFLSIFPLLALPFIFWIWTSFSEDLAKN